MKVAIIGAGVMGLTLAFTLFNQGNAVTLIERPRKKGEWICSDIAAGMLSPIAELEIADELIYSMGHVAIQIHWPKILKILPHAIYFRALGSLLVAHRQNHAELERVVSKIQKHNGHVKKLTQNERVTLEPALSALHHAYYLSNEAQIDGQQYLEKTKLFLSENKVNFCEKEIDQTENISCEYDYIFDCRGLGAKANFSDLYGVRGEIIWLSAPSVDIARPIRFIHPRYRLYIVPRPDNIYLIGASEINTEDDSQISVRTVLELLTAANCVHPGFLEARIIKTATHLRPTLSDGLPKIKVNNNIININGLYRHGFLLAPTLANEIAQYLKNGKEAIQFPNIWRF